jgi:hypothetical protein
MQKTAADLYAAVLLETPNEDLTIPADLIGDMSLAVAIFKERNTVYVLLPRLSLLYVN